MFWTVEKLTSRLERAADIASRLPSVGAKGYTNCWEMLTHIKPEFCSMFDHIIPSYDDVELLMETIRWVNLLNRSIQRKIVWMRARNLSWYAITRRNHCSKFVAKSTWNYSLEFIVKKLNHNNTKAD